jgi:phage recombination protein Bet
MAIQTTKNVPAEKKEWSIEYKSGGVEVKLTPPIIRKYLVRGKGELTTDQEILFFMKICQARGLNPFIGDAYLIKYSGDPAAVVTSIDFFRKRARSQKDCVGWEAGIIVLAKDGASVKYTNGLLLEGEELIGGWAKATPDGWKVEQKLEVNLSGYLRYRKEKETGKRELTKFWEPENQPMMIAKVAESQLLRRLWPDEFQGLQTAEEVDSGMSSEGAIDITPPPKSFEDLVKEKGPYPPDLDIFIEETAAKNRKAVEEIKAGTIEDFENFWKYFGIWRQGRSDRKDGDQAT